MVTVLVVVQSKLGRSERIRGPVFLDRFLKVEILNREVVVAVFVGTANRRIIGFAQRIPDRVLSGEITCNCINTAVDEHGRVIGLRGVERRVAAIFRFEIGYKSLVGLIRQVDDPMLSPWYAERQFAQARERK